MEYLGIIMTGTSGSGKTTIANRLCEISEAFRIVQAVTTCQPRIDNVPDQYSHISEDEFRRLAEEGNLLIESAYRGEYYGITNEAFQQVVDNNEVPLLVLTPESVEKLENAQQQKVLKERLLFLTFFLDAPDEILNDRLLKRGQQDIKTIEEQRRNDRSYSEACIYSVRNMDIDNTCELICALWEYRKTGGVLSKRLIQLMIDCGMLFENAELQKITGAAYDLSVGSEYYYGGQTNTLTDAESFVRIEPYEYAIITSREIANFPRDIAGRFDLSVSLFCRGIILSNGPQVDPGFKGRLFCLLFNTSNDVVELKVNSHYATIEFQKLMEPTIAYSGEYQDKDRIMEYLPKKVSRSPISELKKEIDSLKSEKWLTRTLPIIIAIGTGVVAIVALVLAILLD